MSLRLRRLNKVSPEEMISLEDKLFGNLETVPDEIAEEYYSGNHRDIGELIDEYGL